MTGAGVGGFAQDQKSSYVVKRTGRSSIHGWRRAAGSASISASHRSAARDREPPRPPHRLGWPWRIDRQRRRASVRVRRGQAGPTCQLLPFTVIFEYGVPIQGCVPVRSWAQPWVNLNSLVLGSAAYNAALQAITDQVVLRNKAPGKPNGSALNQLRTNEIALASPWELRQFNLTTPISFLHETPVFNTPDRRFNAADPFWSGSTLLDTFITSGGGTVPPTFLGTPFLGGAAPVTG